MCKIIDESRGDFIKFWTSFGTSVVRCNPVHHQADNTSGPEMTKQ